MSLTNEILIRRIGKDVTLVEGIWSGETHLGMGFANHPEVLFSKAALLAARTPAEDERFPEMDQKLVDLIEQTREALRLDPVSSYDFVSSCMEAGYDIKRDGSNISVWVVSQLQAAARIPLAPKMIFPRRLSP